MRIYDRDLTGSSAAESSRTQDAQKVTREGSRPSGGAVAGSSDRVELSSTLAQLSRAIASSAADRANKVQALAAQYQSGQYQPDALASGQAMIRDALSAGGA